METGKGMGVCVGGVRGLLDVLRRMRMLDVHDKEV